MVSGMTEIQTNEAYRKGLHAAFKIVRGVRAEQVRIRMDAKRKNHIDTVEEAEYAEQILLRVEEAIETAKKGTR